MNRKVYERECLTRSPRFRRDVDRLRRDHPRLFHEPWIRDDRGLPVGQTWSNSDLAALRDFEARHPELTSDYVFAVLQPAPLLFDPAFKAAINHAVTAFWKEHGHFPSGLITRSGIEPVAPSAETDEVYETARRLFTERSEEERAAERRAAAPTVFQDVRLALPIGPDTTLEQIRRVWTLVKEAQRASYGKRRPAKARRPGIYKARLDAYDLIAGRGLTVKSAAKQAGISVNKILRRYQEAVADIGGPKTKQHLDAEGYKEHIARCAQCQQAEARGTSDRYCKHMQRQLGARSGRIKGATDLGAYDCPS